MASPTNLFSCSGVYSFDSSFGMDNVLEAPYVPPPQPYPAEPANEAIDQQPSGIGLGGAQVELVQDSLPSCSTPDPFKIQRALYQVPSLTPRIRRVASYRHPLPEGAPKRGKVTAREMGAYLAIELNKVKPTKIITLPQIVFPDSSLPFPVDEDLLEKLTNVWDEENKVLIQPTAYTEDGIQAWFNKIAADIVSAVQCPPSSLTWSAQYCNTVLPDNELERKPDVILVDKTLTAIDWRSVHAVVEVTSRGTLHSDMMRTINNKTYLMFSTQLNRRFVPFLAICSRKIYFFVTDREGQTIADICHLHHGSYYALNLIRVIVALMFGGPETTGFDPTMTTTPEGDISTISSNGQEYKVKSTIAAVRGIVGRSTRVWSALNANKELCIIKDGWIHKGRAMAEEEHLRALDGVTGVPKLVWGETVQIHNPEDSSRQSFCPDSTAWIRHGFSNETKLRLHRRLVLTPVGQDLSSFTSLGELVAALRDVVVAHQICCERGIIHRDISFNNILLIPNTIDDEKDTRERRGMLIDFDYAASINQRPKISQRTGTPPFMAIALLLDIDKGGDHYAKYDLESLMYVMLFCATMLKGPNGTWRSEADFKSYQSVPLREWFDLRSLEHSYRRMGRSKASHMLYFEEAVIRKMDPYFSPLFPGIRQLKEAIFPAGITDYSNSQIDHQKMIDIFNDILANLPEEHTAKRGVKRSLPTV